MTAREILQSYPLDTCQKVKYDKGKGESEMTELKKKINYTVACVSEFANKHEMTQQAAFQFLYEHKAIAFLKDCYEIEHTLSLMMQSKIWSVSVPITEVFLHDFISRIKS